MNKQQESALDMLDELFVVLQSAKTDTPELMQVLVRQYFGIIRPILTPSRVEPAPADTVTKRHYKKRYRCRVPGEMLDDPVAVDIRKKYNSPVISERVNQVMQVLRKHEDGLTFDDLFSDTKTVNPKMSRWSMSVQLAFAQAKGLAVEKGGKFWSKANYDRKPPVVVHSKSIFVEEKKP